MIKKIKSLDVNLQLPLIDNVLKTSKITNDKEFSNELLKRWAIYFNDKTQWKYIDEDEKEVNAMCFCIVGDSTSNVHYSLEGIKVESEKQQEYITLRQRITAGYKDMHISCDAELEIMSCLKPNQGIGTKLLEQLEKDLKELDVHEYIVCTNEMCSFPFYEHHGFKLLDQRYIDISDLNHIFENKDKFRIMTYIKKI